MSSRITPQIRVMPSIVVAAAAGMNSEEKKMAFLSGEPFEMDFMMMRYIRIKEERNRHIEFLEEVGGNRVYNVRRIDGDECEIGIDFANKWVIEIFKISELLFQPDVDLRTEKANAQIDIKEWIFPKR